VITDYDELATAIRELHRPQVTSTGLKCTECASWNPEQQRLRRMTWPCPTIYMVMPDQDPHYYAS
jgi:hypothetical protein